MQRLIIILVTLALATFAPLEASAQTKSDTRTDYSVKAVLSITYATQNCSGVTGYKVQSGKIEFTSTNSDRKVYINSGNLVGISAARVCNDGGTVWAGATKSASTGLKLTGKGKYAQTAPVSNAPYVTAPYIFNNWIRYQVNEVYSGRVYTHKYCLDNVVHGDSSVC